MRLALALVAGVLAVYLLGYRGPTAGDDLIHLQACDALVSRGALGFPVSEYDPARRSPVRFFFRRGVNGEVYGALPPGLPVVSAPLCAAARWLYGPAVAGATVRAERFGAGHPGDLARLRADPEAFAAGLVNPLACAAVVLLFFLWGLDAGADPRWAATAALVLGLGTFLWCYAESYWTQPLCLLALFGGLLALRRDAEGPGAPALGILGGVLLGAAALFRYEASAIGAVLLAVAAVRLVRRRGMRALWGPVAGWGAAIAVLAGWNWHRFGSPLVTGSPHGSLRDLFGVHVLGRLAFSLPANLVSPNQGLLVFAPPVAVALWIAARAWLRLDLWERAGILLSAGLLVFYSAFVLWKTDQAWGPRFLVLLLPFVLLPVLRHGSRGARRWFVAAGILGAAVQVGGVLTVFTNATILRVMDWPHATRLGWFLRSELLAEWARLAHHGVDALWWSRSPGGEMAAAVLGAIALAAAAVLVTALRRPAPAGP